MPISQGFFLEATKRKRRAKSNLRMDQLLAIYSTSTGSTIHTGSLWA
jgi:hypothetical protein